MYKNYSRISKYCLLLFSAFLLVIIFNTAAVGQNQQSLKPKLLKPVKMGISKPVREMPVMVSPKSIQTVKKTIPLLSKFPNKSNVKPKETMTIQSLNVPMRKSSITQNFEGINANGYIPPDPNGDVGPNHYMQMVNVRTQIWDKNGVSLAGPISNIDFWADLPGPWSGTNDGDPIVRYDDLADRWLVSQMALPDYPAGPFYELIAVSTSSDPTGKYYQYAFQFPDMPDYPKIGVWPDAYYFSANIFASNTGYYLGAYVAAFDRNSMLNGEAASGVYYALPPPAWSLLPADCDGVAPPSGAPNYFIETFDSTIVDNEIKVFEFHVDFNTISNTTFTGPNILSTPSYQMVSNIPQLDGSKLDDLSDRPMNRLQYRNIGTHQSMVVCQTDDAGEGRAGIRWWEFRKTGGLWFIQQEGIYAPSDGRYRWMGSIAMNDNGDIALGYSTSSNTTYTDIRYTGRLASDTPGEMTIGETIIYASLGSQQTQYRWGDYTQMCVDPSNTNTFWYTNQYQPYSGDFNWTTRIAAFNLSPSIPPVISLSQNSFNFNVFENGIIRDTLIFSNIASGDALDLFWNIREDASAYLLPKIKINLSKSVAASQNIKVNRSDLNKYESGNKNYVQSENKATLPVLEKGVPSNPGVMCSNGLVYDDGVYETGYGWITTVNDGSFVSNFVPVAYPYDVNQVCICLTRAGSDPNLNFNIVVYDDDGIDGAPGTQLASIPETASSVPVWSAASFYDYDVSGLIPQVTSGSIYIGINYNPQNEQGFYICADISPTTPLHLGYGYNNLDGWQLLQDFWPSYRALLIRAERKEGVDWLTENPIAGFTSPQSSSNIILDIDAAGLPVGSYNCDLFITSNDPSAASLTVPVQLNVMSATTHFTPIWQSAYLPMNIYVTSATLDGVNLEAGDEVAVFDGDNCVGIGKLSNTIPPGGYLSIIASTDDPTTTELDGFVVGHDITYKFWDAGNSSEIQKVTANYTQGTGSFVSQGTSVVDLSGFYTLSQNIPLNPGWNIFSLLCEPTNHNMLQLLNPLITSGSLVKVQDEMGNAIEELPSIGWINNVGDCANTEGYYLKVNSADTIKITDPPVVLPLNIPLENRWNIISYPVVTAQDAISVFQPLITANQLIKVQDETGNAVEELTGIGWVNNIGNLNSGEGYYLKSNASTSLILNESSKPVIAKSQIQKAAHANIKSAVTHFVPVYSSLYLVMNIYVQHAELMGGIELNTGDEIGIFDGDKCVGASVVTGPISPSSLLAMKASADDPTTTEIDGFTSGHPISYKFWIASSSSEISDYTVGYIVGDGTFSPQGTALINFIEVLPVELNSFTVEQNANEVMLKWETVTEIDNYGFEIEKSIVENSSITSDKRPDLIKWNKIGFIPGNGNSNIPRKYSFVDKDIFSGNQFIYRLKQIDKSGKFTYSNEMKVNLIPNKSDLLQNYPNPFNSTTNFEFQIIRSDYVTLKIYDILGNELRTLINKKLEPGYYKYQWNADKLASGIYYYRLHAGNFSSVKKLILLK